MKNSIESISRGKKLRYGGTAAAFTVSFIALVIVINVIFSALAAKFGWYLDLSSKELFSLSDKTKEVLEAGLADVKDDVKIIFCMDQDELDADPAMLYIHNTAKNLEREFDKIKLEYRDSLRDYDYMSQYLTSSNDTVTTTSVIIQSGTEYRKYESSAFFVMDTDEQSVYAYKGENTFASAILQVTAVEIPIAYFSNGHLEKLTDEATSFIELIRDAGYDIRTIDLSKEDMDPAARLLIINDPEVDFGGVMEEHVGKSEIEKIDEFLDGFGSVMVFVSPENAGKLPNLTEFLDEWGIGFMPGVTIKETPDASVSTDGFSIVGQYNTAENDLGAAVYKTITETAGSENGSLPKVVFKNASPITHTWTTMDKEMTDYSTRFIYDVFMTTPEAHLYKDGEVSEEAGQYSLMTITQEYKLIDNEPFTTYVVAAGTPSVIDRAYLDKTVFKNRDIVHSLLIALGKENVPGGIDYKEFEDYSLDITVGQAQAWTRGLIIVMPLATVIACIVVTVRRKYR